MADQVLQRAKTNQRQSGRQHRIVGRRWQARIRAGSRTPGCRAPAEGKPASLGLIRADGVTVLRPGALPGGLKGSGIDHMAVSVEPAGGSPTGQPTGPVVFYGKLVP